MKDENPPKISINHKIFVEMDFPPKRFGDAPEYMDFTYFLVLYALSELALFLFRAGKELMVYLYT